MIDFNEIVEQSEAAVAGSIGAVRCKEIHNTGSSFPVADEKLQAYTTDVLSESLPVAAL